MDDEEVWNRSRWNGVATREEMRSAFLAHSQAAVGEGDADVSTTETSVNSSTAKKREKKAQRREHAFRPLPTGGGAASFQYELTLGLAVGCVVTSIVYLIFSGTLSEDAGGALAGGPGTPTGTGARCRNTSRRATAPPRPRGSMWYGPLRTRCQGDEMSHVSVGGRCLGLGASRVFAVSDALSRVPACGCARWCWLHGKE